MNEIMITLPRINGFLKRIGHRKFTFADVNNYLVKEQFEKPLTSIEKNILVSFTKDHILNKTYRRREKALETIFWLGEE